MQLQQQQLQQQQQQQTAKLEETPKQSEASQEVKDEEKGMDFSQLPANQVIAHRNGKLNDEREKKRLSNLPGACTPAQETMWSPRKQALTAPSVNCVRKKAPSNLPLGPYAPLASAPSTSVVPPEPKTCIANQVTTPQPMVTMPLIQLPQTQAAANRAVVPNQLLFTPETLQLLQNLNGGQLVPAVMPQNPANLITTTNFLTQQIPMTPLFAPAASNVFSLPLQYQFM
ncbi:hypothetical protein Ciccas_008025 [Cichlidogyrus casuarinus]|uniref:Uncharacterized protein n=1 Tax=Cichlidogyrus casuarinus TaxID=1844966 RepID=A0ABD2Q5A2_9PLAT